MLKRAVGFAPFDRQRATRQSDLHRPLGVTVQHLRITQCVMRAMQCPIHQARCAVHMHSCAEMISLSQPSDRRWLASKTLLGQLQSAPAQARTRNILQTNTEKCQLSSKAVPANSLSRWAGAYRRDSKGAGAYTTRPHWHPCKIRRLPLNCHGTQV